MSTPRSDGFASERMFHEGATGCLQPVPSPGKARAGEPPVALDSGRMRDFDARREIARLHRRQRLLLLGWPLSIVLLLTLGASAGKEPPADSSKILRARGLIIEDDQGRERILLGAPIPKTQHRKRQDPATALLFVGENGADRLALGYSPNPQVGGQVVQRISGGVGIQINDQEGNERAGFGHLDLGRVVLGLDWKNREALTLAVDDKAGYTAIMLAGDKGGHERAGMYVDNDTSVVKIAAPDGFERLILKTTKDEPPELLRGDPKKRKFQNVLPKPEKE